MQIWDSQEKRKKKRRKKHYLLRFLLFAALCAGAYCWLTSTFFDVQKIEVENNSYYTKGQIIAKSEAKTGRNIFGVKTENIKETLLTDPYIKSVRVKRSLPDTITIAIEERREAAMVPYSDIFIIIDSDGLVLRKSNAELKLPLLVGMTIKAMEEGQPLEVEETGVLTDTLKIMGNMEGSEIFFKKIDLSGVIIKAYIYDQLICQGSPENVLESVRNGNLENVLYDLYTREVERGIIYVGSDNYYSFNPMVE